VRSEPTRGNYIVAPIYDWLFFPAPPQRALALGIAISGTAFANSELEIFGYDVNRGDLP